MADSNIIKIIKEAVKQDGAVKPYLKGYIVLIYTVDKKTITQVLNSKYEDIFWIEYANYWKK